MEAEWFRRLAEVLLACGFALALAANAQPAGTPAGGVCTQCGVVLSVRHVEEKGEASGVGAVAGGVLGGVLGHQIGSGRGNTAATIAGAGAGAYAGHQVEKNRNRKEYWSVAVKLDNGKNAHVHVQQPAERPRRRSRQARRRRQAPRAGRELTRDGSGARSQQSAHSRSQGRTGPAGSRVSSGAPAVSVARVSRPRRLRRVLAAPARPSAGRVPLR